jgi:hypothetical protein
MLRDSSCGEARPGDVPVVYQQRRLWRAHNPTISGSQDDRADPAIETVADQQSHA